MYVLEGAVDQELLTHVANHILHQLLVLALFLSPSLYPGLGSTFSSQMGGDNTNTHISQHKTKLF